MACLGSPTQTLDLAIRDMATKTASCRGLVSWNSSTKTNSMRSLNWSSRSGLPRSSSARRS